jgi:hypothetical protein
MVDRRNYSPPIMVGHQAAIKNRIDWKPDRLDRPWMEHRRLSPGRLSLEGA